MRAILASVVMLLFPVLVAAQVSDVREADRRAVRDAMLDYVEAIYETVPERIERSVAPELAKIGYHRSRDTDAWSASPMTYGQLMETARSWNARGRDLSDAPRIIEIFEILDRIASGRLVAAWGVDYMHLVKDDHGTWRIRHVIWQSHTPETAPEARAAVARGGEGAGSDPGR